MTDLETLHRSHVLTPWAAQAGVTAPVITRAEGRYLYDTDGKRYFDLASGLIAVNLGHGHPKVVAAIQEQAAKLCYSSPAWFQDTRAELAYELSKLSPWGSSAEGARTFFTTTGAESNDDAVRLARTLTGRSKVLVAYRSFHGSTGTSITLTGEDRRWAGEQFGAPGVVRFFAPYPYRSPFFSTTPEEECERALDHVKRVIAAEDPRRVAALLIEPVVGSNGVIVYPPGYLAGLRKLTEEHGILLICDEVMTGFGRTGAAFACTRYGIVPDMLVFAKGVTSAYVPLGGVMIRESLAKQFDDKPLPSGHTYSGHPLATAVGLAAVRAYQEEGLFERANEVGGWITAHLGALKEKHSFIGDVRGVGAFHAIELVKDRVSKEPLVPWQGPHGLGVMKGLYGELKKRGIYTFGRYHITMVAPPLTTERHELDEAIASLDDALGEFAKTL